MAKKLKLDDEFTLTKRKSDILKKQIARYNQKIRYYEKKEGYDKSYLPEKLTFKGVKDVIKTNRDYEIQKDLMKVFLARYSTATYMKTNRGAKVPQFTKKQNDIKIKEENRKKEIQWTAYQNEQVSNFGLEILQTDWVRDNFKRQFAPIKYDYKNKSKRDVQVFSDTLESYTEKAEEEEERWIENYIQGVKNVYGEKGEKEIRDVFSKLSKEKIITTFYNDLSLRISFIYEPFDKELEENNDKGEVSEEDYQEYKEQKDKYYSNIVKGWKRSIKEE